MVESKRAGESAQQTWPRASQYCEALQNPRLVFGDPELRNGTPLRNAFGVPTPFAGAFADVYQIACPSGHTWAVKCFKRDAPLRERRYLAMDRCLRRARLPFMVDFEYLVARHGVRVGGEWFPIVKMRWVKGQALNEFVAEAQDNPQRLRELQEVWLRLAVRLRQAGVAHGDLQHGNVLLVPDPQGLRLNLLDYDGMFVPEIAELGATEAGHPNYQHPARSRECPFDGELDRFSHLLIYTALRCLRAGGRSLWERFDNGENLLFTRHDLEQPVDSPLFRELWTIRHEECRGLVGRLFLAAQQRMSETPRLEDLVVDGKVRGLTQDELARISGCLASSSGAPLEGEMNRPRLSGSPALRPLESRQGNTDQLREQVLQALTEPLSVVYAADSSSVAARLRRARRPNNVAIAVRVVIAIVTCMAVLSFVTQHEAARRTAHQTEMGAAIEQPSRTIVAPGEHEQGEPPVQTPIWIEPRSPRDMAPDRVLPLEERPEPSLASPLIESDATRPIEPQTPLEAFGEAPNPSAGIPLSAARPREVGDASAPPSTAPLAAPPSGPAVSPAPETSLADFPDSVTLPVPGTSRELGEIRGSPLSQLKLRLIGGNLVMGRDAKLATVAPDGSDMGRAWEVVVSSRGTSEPSVAARLWLDENNALRFVWGSAVAEASVGAVSNSVLELSTVTGQVATCALRRPIRGKPLPFRMLRGGGEVRWEIPHAPPTALLHVQPLALEEILPPFETTPKSGAATPGQDLEIKLDAADDDPLSIRVKIVVKMVEGSLVVRVLPQVVVQNKSAPLQRNSLDTVLLDRQVGALQTKIRAAEATAKRLETAADPNNTESQVAAAQAATQARELNDELQKCLSRRDRMDSLQGVLDRLDARVTQLHFRVWADLGDVSFDILSTTPD